MTRRQTLFQIKNVLKKWENSKLNLKCANEILTRLEELGYVNSEDLIVPGWAQDEDEVPEFVATYLDGSPFEIKK